jgi:hypothetical protein
MRGWLLSRVRRYPGRCGVALLCVVAALAVGVAHGRAYLELRAFSAACDAMVADEHPGPRTTATWAFPFRSDQQRISVAVSLHELSQAHETDTGIVFNAPRWARERAVVHLVRTQAAGPLVAALADEFRALRRELALDDDEYLELMVSAVQYLPYGDIEYEILLPAEVIAYREGVCTEKSVLLAALMTHEGYDTALWVLDSQRHVALGVASAENQFRHSGYAFVETTVPHYIGQADAAYWASRPSLTTPQLIKLGGTRAYGAGAQTAFILQELRRNKMVALQSDRYARASRTDGRWSERYAQRAAEAHAADRLAAFITGNTHDRAGVFAALTARDVEYVPMRGLER